MSWWFRVGAGAQSGKQSWWLFDDAGGKVAWAGAFFDTPEQAAEACRKFQSAAASDLTFEIFEGQDERPRWRAKAKRKLVAMSGGPFDTKSAAVHAAHQVRERAKYAGGPS
jgi:hypothetical protein